MRPWLMAPSLAIPMNLTSAVSHGEAPWNRKIAAAGSAPCNCGRRRTKLRHSTVRFPGVQRLRTLLLAIEWRNRAQVRS